MKKNKILTLIIIFCFLAYLLEIERKVREVVVPTISGISAQLFQPAAQTMLLSSAVNPKLKNQ